MVTSLRGVLFLVAMMSSLDCGAFGQQALDSHMPSLSHQTESTVEINDAFIKVTFGPVNLPTGYHEDLAVGIPERIFKVPQDMYITGYKAEVLKGGNPLSGPYLHHILMSKLGEESISCPGELNFFAGTGFELTEAKFPIGYGVKLEKGQKVLAVVDFYHKAPPTKGVLVSFTMELAPEGTQLQPLQTEHIGVNFGCYTKFHLRSADETMDGISLKPGVFVRSASLKFQRKGCIKYAYPHAHDQLLLMTLENKTARRTLLRTMPNVQSDGTLLNFPISQIYSDIAGFPINPQDEYEVTMVYHKPLHDEVPRYGMANFLLFLTPGSCSDTYDQEKEASMR